MVSLFSMADALKPKFDFTAEQDSMLLSSPCGPFTHHWVVVTCRGQVVCHRETTTTQQTTAPSTAHHQWSCPLLSPTLRLKSDQKSKSVPQSASLFSVKLYVRRRKDGEGKKKRGKWKRKLLMSLNHERLGLGLE